MPRARTQTEMERRARIKAHKRGMRWCVLCGSGGLRVLEWIDPLFPERGVELFVLCYRCSTTNYAEILNQKHRTLWKARYGTKQIL